MNVIGLLGKKLTVFMAAVLAAYLLASATATQHVANALVSMGIELKPADRLAMTFQDLLGLASSLLPLIALGLLIAFVVAAALLHWPLRNRPRWRLPLYLLAGFTALVMLHVLMNLALGLTPIAIARSPFGIIVQGLAGSVGGLVYARLSDAVFPANPFDPDP